MKYSPVVPWDWSADGILASMPQDVKHLIFNCHGYLSRPSFLAPHLSIGTVIHPGNVSAFEQLWSIKELGVIWISACNLAGSSAGKGFCEAMAMYSGCYVVAQQTEVPDVAVREGHIEDYWYAMPRYCDPAGDWVSREEFFAMGDDLGFARV